MKNEHKTYLYFLKTASIPLILLIFVILSFRACNESNIKSKQEIEISKIVNNTIDAYAKKNLLLPKLIFINTDSLSDEQLKDTLKKQIVDVLTRQYLKDDTVQLNNLKLKPFFIVEKNQNPKDKNVSITQEQHNELLKHLEFLTKQVDVEVTRAKTEVERDISRLNTWVTLWVALIGFLGIFFPLFVNYEIKSVAEKALRNANHAKVRTENVLVNIKKAEESAAKAMNLAGKTEIKTEKLLLATNAIGSLRSIDEHTLNVISDPKKALLLNLQNIHSELLDCNEDFFSHKIIRDCLRQLAVKLHVLSLNDVYQNFMKEMNEMSVSISDSLKIKMTKESFELLLSKLNDLNVKIKEE